MKKSNKSKSRNLKNRNSKKSNSKYSKSRNSKKSNSKYSKSKKSKSRNSKNRNSKNRKSKKSKSKMKKSKKSKSRNSKNRNSKNKKRTYNYFDLMHPQFDYTPMGLIEYDSDKMEIKTYVYIGPNDKLSDNEHAFSCDRLTFEIQPLKNECGANGCIHLAKVIENPCEQQVWWLPVNSVVVIKLDVYSSDRFSDEKYKFDIVTQQLNGKDILVNQYGLFWSRTKDIPKLLKLFKFPTRHSVFSFALFQIMEYFQGSSAAKLLKQHDILRIMSDTRAIREQNNKIYKQIRLNLCDKIKQLHNLGFVHGDIHLNNILVNPDTFDARLIDLGSLKIIREYDEYQDPWINEFEGGAGFGNEKFYYWNPKNPYYYPDWKQTYDLCKSIGKI